MKQLMSKNVVVKIYIAAIAMVALGNGLSDTILANYFKDAYQIDAMQRAFIEFPRELPGILTVFVIAILARFGDIRIAVLAQVTSMVGILILGITTPNFYTMTAFLFIFSLGVHMFMPLQDSIAMSIMSSLKDVKVGTALGTIKGIGTAFSLLASLIVFLGFRFGIFQLEEEIRWIFVLAGIILGSSAVLLFLLLKKVPPGIMSKPKLMVKKKYTYYYILAVMHGVQKQVVIVFAPWVIIEILEQGADTISLLTLISALAGIAFLPFLGVCLDKFGIRKMLYADALSFILVYLAFAYMTYQLSVGNYAKTGIAAIITFAIFVIDRMSSQMGFIRTVYLNTIIDKQEELLPTISFGICLDHVIAISCSLFSGWIWMNLGAHYIFILAATFSIINLIIARIVPLNNDKK